MKHFLAVLFLVIFTFSISASPPGPNEDLQKIFSDARIAVGSQTVIGRIKSIEAFAVCTGPNGNYTTEIKSFRSNKTHFKQNFSYKNESSNIFINNSLAWTEPDSNNKFALVSDFQKLVVTLHEYQKLAIDFQKMFADFEYGGEELFNRSLSFKIKAKNSLGGTIYLFFDKKTKLPAGYILPIPGSKESVVNVFHEWTRIEGVRLPSKITATDSSGDWVLNFNQITFNKADETLLTVPDRVSDLADLMRWQKQSEKAHLTYDAELLTEKFHENGITQVNRGEVSVLTREAGLKRFKSYFESVKFLEWADIKPPVIRLSDDGTLATIIVQKRVRTIPKNETDEQNLSHYEFAWTEVWQKSKGGWKLVSVISTDKKIEKKAENPSSKNNDLDELMRLHKQHQTAHLTYNVELFVETFAEKLINVQSGEVTARTKDENRKRLKGYFSSYKFKEWKDVKPPVIKISGDGTLATVIVEKLVSGTYQNEKGETVSDKTEFAWLEVWEKIDGQWKVLTVASTRKPQK